MKELLGRLVAWILACCVTWSVAGVAGMLLAAGPMLIYAGTTQEGVIGRGSVAVGLFLSLMAWGTALKFVVEWCSEKE